MNYYTIEKAATLLSNTPSPEWLLKQMIDPDKLSDGSSGSFITPSWFSEDPILLMAQESGRSLPGWFSGWFEIDGLHEPGRIRNGEVCFDSPARYLSLSRENIRFIPVEPMIIPITNFRISYEQLELFAAQTGRKLKLPHVVPESEHQVPVVIATNDSRVVIQKVSKTGGDLRSGKSYTPENRFMDDLLDDYRNQYKCESEDFDSLLTCIFSGKKSKGTEYGYTVLAVDRDAVTLKIKRSKMVLPVKKLKKIWEDRKKRNPFKAE